MAKTTYPPGAGDVTIELGNEILVLKPTLQAGIAVSRQTGGIRGAIEKVMALDLDAIVSIIRVGIGPKEAKRLVNLDQLIYENGFTDSQGALGAKLIEFLANIARGGKPADDEDKEGQDSLDPPRPPQS